MNIKIKDYEIVSDSSCYHVYKLGKGKDKKTGKMKDIKKTVGYYSSIESLFKCLPDKMLMESGCTSLSELHKLMYEYKQLIEKELSFYITYKKGGE